MDMQQTGQKCNCFHHKLVPIFIVLLGVLFLLGAMDVIAAHTVSVVWPVIVILAGLQKLMGHNCKCCSSMQ